MVRLNAKLAAAQTKKRLDEIELDAQKALIKNNEEKRLRQLANRKEASQERKIIQAAINGELECEIHEDLLSASRLLERKFEIYYVDFAGYSAACKEVDKYNEKIEKDLERQNDTAQIKFEKSVSALVHKFLGDLGRHSKFQGMTATREMLLKETREKIFMFRDLLADGEFLEDPTDLFSFIFDSRLYLYQPIPEFKPLLKQIEKIIRDGLDYDLASPLNSDNENYADDPDLRDYTTLIDSSACFDAVATLKNQGDYFIIQWGASEIGTLWEFDELFSPESLCWLASPPGKAFFEIFETTISRATACGSSSVDLVVNWFGPDYKVPGAKNNKSAPYPDQICSIAKHLGYKAAVHRTDGDSIEVSISW